MSTQNPRSSLPPNKQISVFPTHSTPVPFSISSFRSLHRVWSSDVSVSPSLDWSDQETRVPSPSTQQPQLPSNATPSLRSRSAASPTQLGTCSSHTFGSGYISNPCILFPWTVVLQIWVCPFNLLFYNAPFWDCLVTCHWICVADLYGSVVI